MPVPRAERGWEREWEGSLVGSSHTTYTADGCGSMGRSGCGFLAV